MSLRILQWKCRKFFYKLVWFICTLIYKRDILGFQETFLSPERSVVIQEKIVYRLKKLSRPGDGLLIAVICSLSSVWFNKIKSNSNNEVMGMRNLLDSFSLINKCRLFFPFKLIVY